MERKYFACKDLGEMKRAQMHLLRNGLGYQQIHVLSYDDHAVAAHRLPAINLLAKNNLLNSTIIGTILGVSAALAAFMLAHLLGVHEQLSWMPQTLMAMVLLGFTAWDGGVVGSLYSRRFARLLADGFHVMVIDYEPDQLVLVKELPDASPYMSGNQITI